MNSWLAYIAGIGTAGLVFGFIAVCRNLEMDNDDEEWRACVLPRGIAQGVSLPHRKPFFRNRWRAGCGRRLSGGSILSVNWSYEQAGSSRHGTMTCTACGKQIEHGRYRYRRKSSRGDWGYVSQHEACSAEDPKWGAWDALIAEGRREAIRLSDACREFKARWGVSELDEYILDEPA